MCNFKCQNLRSWLQPASQSTQNGIQLIFQSFAKRTQAWAGGAAFRWSMCGTAGSAHSKIYTFHNQMMRFSARTFIAAWLLFRTSVSDFQIWRGAWLVAMTTAGYQNELYRVMPHHRPAISSLALASICAVCAPPYIFSSRARQESERRHQEFDASN